MASENALVARVRLPDLRANHLASRRGGYEFEEEPGGACGGFAVRATEEVLEKYLGASLLAQSLESQRQSFVGFVDHMADKSFDQLTEGFSESEIRQVMGLNVMQFLLGNLPD